MASVDKMGLAAGALAKCAGPDADHGPNYVCCSTQMD
jgi:hypothetical protein